MSRELDTNLPLSSGPAKVCVAIVSYNGRAFLDELLESLRAQSETRFETILIDNASRDGSATYVGQNFPWVRVLSLPQNLGFSRAVNLAARETEAEFLATLNTDLKLEPTWLKTLLEVATQDESVAAVASKLRLYHQPTVLNGVGGAMNQLGYTWDRGMFEEDKGQYDQSQEVLFASAGAALFRRSAFLASGGFDEEFFMYHEDVDLCWRLWLLGFRVVTAPAAVAFHHFGASTQAHEGMIWRELLGERHNIRALLKNYEASNLRSALWGLLKRPQPPVRKWNQCRNFFWNLRKLHDTLKRRKWNQDRRRRSDAELQFLIVQSNDVPIRL